jgi:uncharacterized protein
MKQSNYNFFFPLEEGHFLAFNSLKNGLAKIGKELADKIQSHQPGTDMELDENVLKELKKGGFLVEDDFDEYQYLCLVRRMTQFSTTGLGLTIAPSLNCNLACYYCFENPDPAIMDEKTIKALITYVENHIKSGIKRLGITWYGGEPLLNLGIIEQISNELIPLCKKNKVHYSAGIITNGILFTREAARRLKRLKVSFAQITLDGDKETHDKRRPLKSKGSSFDSIMSNLKASAGIIPISLRINLDTSNVEKALEFVKSLYEEPWFKKQMDAKMLNPYYGHVMDFTAECKCQKEEILKTGDFWEKDLELKRFLYQNMKEFTHYPTPSYGCTATSLQAFVVDAKGNLYKCWNHLGISSKKVGNVSEPMTLNGLNVQYLTESFETDDECKTCSVLPICMGGCVDIRVGVKRGDFNAKDCSKWKYFLEESLRDFYLGKQNQKLDQSQITTKNKGDKK